jgi:dsDNA-specific endonuclease/ATPase MutS2
MWRNTVSDEPVLIPVDGVLDLHTFRPNETADVVEEYLLVCLEKKIKQVRIIHGKGKGVQLKIVHSLLKRLDYVSSFKGAEETAGGWGATIVTLKTS